MSSPALPLFQCDAPKQFPRSDANTGLWYDKFCSSWDADWKMSGEKKLAWIKTVAGVVGSRALIEEFAERQRQLADRSGGKVFQFTTDSRFATGLGREHPVENGFAWHHTLGTPYLPGSSIKGLIRNWAEQWDAATEGKSRQEIKQEVNAVLGGPGSVGRVLLLDALPTAPPTLEPDVMTPHYGDYYQSPPDNVKAPGDWLSPIPIPFLVVAKDQSFQFAIMPNTLADEHLINTVSEWLIEALQWLGAGAKTSVGYGRFERNKAAEEKLEREATDRKQKAAEAEAERLAQEARMSGLSAEVRAIAERAEREQWQVAPGAFVPAFQKFLDESPALSAEAIEWIKTNCLDKHWKGCWANPLKLKKPNQKALVERLKVMLGK